MGTKNSGDKGKVTRWHTRSLTARPSKIDGWKTTFLLEWQNFRGYVKLPRSTCCWSRVWWIFEYGRFFHIKKGSTRSELRHFGRRQGQRCFLVVIYFIFLIVLLVLRSVVHHLGGETSQIFANWFLRRTFGEMSLNLTTVYILKMEWGKTTNKESSRARDEHPENLGSPYFSLENRRSHKVLRTSIVYKLVRAPNITNISLYKW